MKKPLLFGFYVLSEALKEVSGIERENSSIRHVTVENIAYLLINEENSGYVGNDDIWDGAIKMNAAYLYVMLGKSFDMMFKPVYIY